MPNKLVFSDEDFKRFKDTYLVHCVVEMVKGSPYIPIHPDELKALLTRLEAAEDCIHGHHSNCASQMDNDRCSCGVFRWRKSCGRDG